MSGPAAGEDMRRVLRRLTEAAALVCSGIGAAVLFGWAFDFTFLKSIHPSFISMKADTALGLVGAGLALWLLREEPVASGRRRLAQLLALYLIVVGGACLTEDLSGVDLGIDQILVYEPPGTPHTLYPGRLAPATSVCFSLLGLALVLLDRPTRRGTHASGWLVLPAAFLSLVALVGYAYGITFFSGSVRYTPMALHTAVALLTLSLGILTSRPEHMPAAATVRDTTGGLLMRNAVLPLVLFQVTLGAVVLPGVRSNLYGSDFALALTAGVNIAATAGLLIWLALRLDELDEQRSTFARQLAQARDEALAASRLKSEFLANM
ncbi:MAG: hypothetical protein HY303_11910, partial [Candidatus Wallbacteria bacterium]|nr:hypothetical protein [Candidatus Wallbacteria bacterium]